MEIVFDQFPVLRSEELVLGKIEEQHLDGLFEIYSNDHVFEYCGIIPKHNKTTVKSMIGHYERDYGKRSRIKWGIFAPADDTHLLGIIEACDFNQRVNMVTIGYFLAEAQWGKGLASKAVELLTAFLFQQAQVNRIQAEVMLNNEPSKKVLLKNGYVKEGMLRQAALWSGKGVVDLEIYSMLREEYMKVLQPDHEALILQVETALPSFIRTVPFQRER
ncbi:GNAT family N-acetyltransferase [Paenibacillus silagei]|nr:GNAT family protein [Paenibacillus silagei]